jgi:threonine dehydrogenase-like Zn-dependent dehydrogenase
MAIARFQLMAASGLRHIGERLQVAERVIVVGTGPVAVGAVLELLRTTDAEVWVVTRRREHASGLFHGLNRVFVGDSRALRDANNVIECTGEPGSIRACVTTIADSGLIGLLGSPREPCLFDLYAMHRRGVVLVGMHELAGFDAQWRLPEFREVAAWLDAMALHQRQGWFAWTPAREFVRFYEGLCAKRLREPFQLLDWRGTL